MKQLKVIAEFSGRNWSAFSPQVDGVIATGDDLRECVDVYLSALRFHLEGMVDDGEPIPPVDLGRAVIFPTVSIGDLGKFRRSLGMNQSVIAERMGLPQSRISAIERKPGSVSFERVQRYLAIIAELADMPVVPSVTLVDAEEPESA